LNATNHTNSDRSFAIVILAGGSSSRLGKPKQLLQYQSQTFIKHVVKTALEVSPKTIIVVSGFLHHELVAELENEPVQLIHNDNWKEGMGSSVRTGIDVLSRSDFPKVDAALILLCDQPLITANHLEKLLTQFYTNKQSKIVATAYADTKGVPAVFDYSLFPILTNLPGSKGAKWLLKEYQEMVSTIHFEGAAIDVDTEDDYQRLTNLSRKSSNDG
jgi:molybdenum cofactor cytidylyltransferase